MIGFASREESSPMFRLRLRGIIGLIWPIVIVLVVAGVVVFAVLR